MAVAPPCRCDGVPPFGGISISSIRMVFPGRLEGLYLAQILRFSRGLLIRSVSKSIHSLMKSTVWR